MFRFMPLHFESMKKYVHLVKAYFYDHYTIFWTCMFPIFFSNSFAQKRQLPVDTLVVTNHKTTIKGTAVSYRAETGTQPVWNEKGQPIASLFYTYYRRTNVNNGTARPLIFSFNGGPGSASVWMHVAYTDPVY